MPEYKEYDPKTLRKLQELLLMMLKDIDAVCTKHGIPYFLNAGTGIGLLRHQGFIPWDDDIDIYFHERDCRRLLQHIPAEFGDKYIIENAETDEHYPLMITMLVLNGTVFRPKPFKDLPYRSGIYLDLFSMYNTPDSNAAMRLQGFRAWFWGKLLILYHVPKPVLFFTGWKKALLHFFCGAAHRFLHLIPATHEKLYRRALRAATACRDADTKRMADFFDTKPNADVLDKADIYPTRPALFEGETFQTAKNLESILTAWYGDFMTLPPPEKRYNHPPDELDFGPWADEDET
jgi:lipopolysaccharide cholinephosphotransferase